MTGDLYAEFLGATLRVVIPENLAQAWGGNDEEVGMANEAQKSQGDGVKILIEKDFKCLTPRAHEDESDNFPHPGTAHHNC